MRSSQIRDRRLWMGMVAVFAMALAARLTFLFEFSAVPLFVSPTMDMLYHDQWARDILAGSGGLYVPFFRAPLYPYVLALIYFLFGTGGWGVGLVQSVLGSASAVLVFLLGRRVLGQGPGLVAGLLTALWGTLIFYDIQPLVPCLVIFLNLLALCFLLPEGASVSRWRTPAGALCLGLSAIARPTILLFAAVYAVWLVVKARRRSSGISASHVLLYLSALLLPMLPVTAYNVARSGQTVLIGSYSGLNFYIGNHLGSDGVSAQLPGARQDWWGMMEDAALQAERESGRALNPSEQSAFWWSKASSEIREDPLAWLVLLSKKAVFLLQGIELSNNLDFYYFAHRGSLLKPLVLKGPLFFPWGLFIVPALVGLVISLRGPPAARVLAWYALSYGAAVVLFFVTARYRLPLVPVVALFAVSGARFLWQQFVRRSTVWRIGALAALTCLLVAANADFFRHAPRSEAPGLFAMATAYQRTQRLDLAEQYYYAAMAEDPTYVQSYNDLGLLQVGQGELNLAIETLARGVKIDPEHTTLLYNLAWVQLLAGQGDSAAILLQSVVARQPENLDALNNLGAAFNMTGRFDSARACFEQVLQRAPDFPSARFGLGCALQELGRPDSARACFRACVADGVSVAESFYRMGQSWIAEGQIDSAVADLRRCLDQLSTGPPGAAGEVQQLLDSLLQR